MIMDVIMSWMKITVILAGFFVVSGERWSKKGWKYQVLTLFAMILCILVRIFPFQNLSIRYMIEVSILFLYIVLYCQKELGRHFMCLLIVYVMLDVALIFGGIIVYILQGCSPGENYQLWQDVTIIVIYVSLFFLFLMIQKRAWYVPIKSGFTIAEAGMTFILLFAKSVVLVFIGMGKRSESTYPFYAFSFLSALVIGALWIIDKRAREKQAQEQMQDYIRYEHRMREVLPTVGKALEKMENLSENSEEAAQIIEELKAVCRTDKEITQKEILTAKTFAPTGSPVFDSMLERILQEAAQDGVEVEIIARAKVSELLKAQKIEIGLFLQMFGDIYRNANKAVLKQGDGGRILIYMGYNRSGAYELSISDNGVPFPQHVLEHLGERGVTADGTGHGLADTFSVLDKYKVSFYLKQNPGQNVVYSKTIRLVFDEEGHREIS